MPSLAVVTSYFNPCHYRSRYKNYLLFAEGMRQAKIRLLTVELAFGDDPFELKPSENILQLRTPDVMWQKERLINIGIESLPPSVDKVIWADCDVMFNSLDWGEKVADALQHYTVVQCFNEATRLPKDPTDTLTPRQVLTSAVARRLMDGTFAQSTPGYCWAARRDFLNKYKLYDAMIVGGGDLAMLMAFFYDEEFLPWAKDVLKLEMFQPMSRAHYLHYLKWVEPVAKELNGKVGFVEQPIFALFHGDKERRFYNTRHKLITGFDPYIDITLGEDRCWHWTNVRRKEIAKNVREYFLYRGEDD